LTNRLYTGIPERWMLGTEVAEWCLDLPASAKAPSQEAVIISLTERGKQSLG
jgi:hypothetical protein